VTVVVMLVVVAALAEGCGGVEVGAAKGVK